LSNRCQQQQHCKLSQHLVDLSRYDTPIHLEICFSHQQY
jgi:hypothetical protein